MLRSDYRLSRWLVLLLALFLLIACSCHPDEDDDEDQAEADDDETTDDDADDDSASDDDLADDDSAETNPDWYRSVVFMEIFVRSYYDSDGDGIGDFPGLTQKLPYLTDLGIGALWLMPIYPTPFFDSGYDVADYEAINPDYGTMEDFTAFLARAHELGLRVFLDGVFNHTSEQHAWFVESRSSRDNPKRDWYLWSDEPLFDCPTPLSPGANEERWTYDEQTGQYYYHYFRRQMPDLNYYNPDVREAVKNVARFWLDLGVDGFRLDTAHLYYEDEQYCFHHPLTHEFLRELRQVLDEYPDRAMVGEVAGTPRQLLAYVGDGSDELHMFFNFDLNYALLATLYLQSPFITDLMLKYTYERIPPGGQQAVFLDNHDWFRTYDMLLRRDRWAKLASAWVLTLPGTAFLYYGEEIGMADGWQVLVDYRDAARTPMHWTGGDNAGFTTGAPWIALAPNYKQNNVATETDDAASLLRHYRKMIHLRNDRPALSQGSFQAVDTNTWPAYAYARSYEDQTILVVLNFSFLPQQVYLNLKHMPWAGSYGPVRDLYTDLPMTDLDAGNEEAYPVSLNGLGFAVLSLEVAE